MQSTGGCLSLPVGLLGLRSRALGAKLSDVVTRRETTSQEGLKTPTLNPNPTTTKLRLMPYITLLNACKDSWKPANSQLLPSVHVAYKRGTPSVCVLRLQEVLLRALPAPADGDGQAAGDESRGRGWGGLGFKAPAVPKTQWPCSGVFVLKGESFGRKRVDTHKPQS